MKYLMGLCLGIENVSIGKQVDRAGVHEPGRLPVAWLQGCLATRSLPAWLQGSVS